MRQVMDLAARRLTVAAAAYYHFNHSLMDDAEYDALSRLVADNWPYLALYYQEVFESPEAIRATGSHILMSQQAYQATLRELREAGLDHDVGAHEWEPVADWEGDGVTVPVMGFGG
jgi:hypothetical protein